MALALPQPEAYALSMNPKSDADIEADTDIVLVNVDDPEAMAAVTKNMSPAELADFLAHVEEGKADVRAGRTVSAEKVRAWIESWGTDNELPMPECDE